MLALTVAPKAPGSGALQDLPPLVVRADRVVAKTLAIGVCGTDREILRGEYGFAPPGRERLVLGHESLAEVETAPPGSALQRGDLIVGIVRHPDPEPCRACAAGEWDMCLNGRYTEHGIKELDGFAVEQFLIEPEFAVRIDAGLHDCGVLIEPASVVAKAWSNIDYIGSRARSWRAGVVLVTGAGTIGLLAAMMARQRGCELHVYDRDRGDTKRDLVERLGGRYHCDSLDEVTALMPDVVLECTGVPAVIAAVIGHNAPGAIVCLAGLSAGVHEIAYDFAGLNRSMVLENDVVFGTVNANRRHYELAADALQRADVAWLRGLISRRVALAEWQLALEHRPGDIKVVIDFSS